MGELHRRHEAVLQSEVFQQSQTRAREDLDVQEQRAILRRARQLLDRVNISQLGDVIEMLELQIKGYYHVDWVTRVAFFAALIYLVSVIDVVSDMIPGVGYLDDIAVLQWTICQHAGELERFRLWKQNNPDVYRNGKDSPCCQSCTLF